MPNLELSVAWPPLRFSLLFPAGGKPARGTMPGQFFHRRAVDLIRRTTFNFHFPSLFPLRSTRAFSFLLRSVASG